MAAVNASLGVCTFPMVEKISSEFLPDGVCVLPGIMCAVRHVPYRGTAYRAG